MLLPVLHRTPLVSVCILSIDVIAVASVSAVSTCTAQHCKITTSVWCASSTPHRLQRCGVDFCASVRARISAAASSSARYGSIMDDAKLLEVLERQRYRATALDVSLKTGETVEDSEEAMAQLLAVAGGSYEFRGETVVYIFPRDVKSKLSARRAKARLRNCCAAASTVAQYAVGAFVLLATLFVAVVVVAFAVAAAVAALKGDGRSRRGPNLRGGIRDLGELVRTWNLCTSMYWCCGGTNPFFRPVPFGFYYGYGGPFGGYGGYGYGYPGYGYGLGSALRHARRRRNVAWTRAVVRDGVLVAVPADQAPQNENLPVATAVVDDGDQEALLDEGGDASPPPHGDDAVSALHAFLFGPNVQSAADHWRRVASVISGRGGVIAPEELAPHLPAPPASLRASEAAAAEACAHFRGKPRRCEDGGGVVFVFTEFTAGASPDGDDALVEDPAPFAGLSDGRTLACAGLVGGNVLALGLLRSAVAGPLAIVVSFFFVYSLAILAIPSCRYATLAVSNRALVRRNATRRLLADELRRARDDDVGVAARVRFAERCVPRPTPPEGGSL